MSIDKALCRGETIQDKILKSSVREVMKKKEDLIIENVRKLDPEFADKLKYKPALYSSEIKHRLEIRNYEDDPADYYYFDNRPLLMILPVKSDVKSNIEDGLSMEVNFKYKILLNEEE